MKCHCCGGDLSALHHTGQRAMVHYYCLGCGAHLYGVNEDPKWWTKREWSEWIEESPEPSTRE